MVVGIVSEYIYVLVSLLISIFVMDRSVRKNPPVLAQEWESLDGHWPGARAQRHQGGTTAGVIEMCRK